MLTSDSSAQSVRAQAKQKASKLVSGFKGFFSRSKKQDAAVAEEVEAKDEKDEVSICLHLNGP